MIIMQRSESLTWKYVQSSLLFDVFQCVENPRLWKTVHKWSKVEVVSELKE
jgi:hypothetical protein